MEEMNLVTDLPLSGAAQTVEEIKKKLSNLNVWRIVAGYPLVPIRQACIDFLRAQQHPSSYWSGWVAGAIEETMRNLLSVGDKMWAGFFDVYLFSADGPHQDRAMRFAVETAKKYPDETGRILKVVVAKVLRDDLQKDEDKSLYYLPALPELLEVVFDAIISLPNKPLEFAPEDNPDAYSPDDPRAYSKDDWLQVDRALRITMVIPGLHRLFRPKIHQLFRLHKEGKVECGAEDNTRPRNFETKSNQLHLEMMLDHIDRSSE